MDSQEPNGRKQPSYQQPHDRHDRVSKAERRIAFRQAKSQGLSTVEAAKVAGISEPTAYRWAKQSNRQSAESIVDASSILSRHESASILSTIGRDANEQASARVAALGKLADVMDYNAPMRQEITHMHMAVRDWVLAGVAPIQSALKANSQPAALIGEREQAHRQIEAGVDPPIEAAAEAFSPPQNISTNLAKEVK